MFQWNDLEPPLRLPSANPLPTDSRYRYAKRRYRILFRLLDALVGPVVGVARKLAPPPAWPDPRSILVVQLDHIGDAVLTTPMLRALRQRLPHTAIDVLAAPWNQEIFRSNPHVRRVHLSERNWQSRGPRGCSYLSEVLRLGRDMRRFQYDLAIDPRGDVLIAIIIWLAGISRRLGWSCGGGGFLLTDVAAWDPQRHEAESRLALLECLGVHGGRTEPELFPSWADCYAMREMLATLSEAQPPVAIVHVGAGTAAKRWPAAHLAKFVQGLSRQIAGSVILVGDARDQDRSRRIACANPRTVDWTGRLSLMQLAALLGEADLFVGADSGPAHIAAAMGTPSIVLFSGTNRAECWQPVGPKVLMLQSQVPCSPCHLKQCPVPGHPCMAGISPSEVLEAVRQLVPFARVPHKKTISSLLQDPRPELDRKA